VARRLIGEAEHFWQTRYYDLNIRNRRQFSQKLLYIHRNPVVRGLCPHPEDWEWSSFRHYATGTAGSVEIESDWTARRREQAAEPSPKPSFEGRLSLPKRRNSG
jgi:REP-associated tyrosine transposase